MCDIRRWLVFPGTYLLFVRASKVFPLGFSRAISPCLGFWVHVHLTVLVYSARLAGVGQTSGGDFGRYQPGAL